MNKKGIVDPFDIASRIGYYILTLMIMSVLFLFIAVLLKGSELTLYKANFGTNTVNLEERAIDTITYEDPITLQKLDRIIDPEKYATVTKADLDRSIGIGTETRYKAVKMELYNNESTMLFGKSIMTSNYPEGRIDFQKTYPVLIRHSENSMIRYETGTLKIFMWKP